MPKPSSSLKTQSVISVVRLGAKPKLYTQSRQAEHCRRILTKLYPSVQDALTQTALMPICIDAIALFQIETSQVRVDNVVSRRAFVDLESAEPEESFRASMMTAPILESRTEHTIEIVKEWLSYGVSRMIVQRVNSFELGLFFKHGKFVALRETLNTKIPEPPL